MPKERADRAGEPYAGEFGLISLSVHSDLAAVGLTAAIDGALTEQGISANVVAAFDHDHLFVPVSQTEDAMATRMRGDFAATWVESSTEVVGS
ncbi:ACT domain-containing protein [Rhodopirellula sp. SWK7]|uniref:ACT domain-containing protein n=1 Tax=Rhodopirellula sp. SWK7 TaxID=595460 RepID=UPI0002BEF5DE|nr:ACT domain-containing protein [Rhodopirellula sp. SWK7]EMI41039.1 hypothetical protein RRSWK_06437 [Rhodopirellula sp. SWK7]